MKLNNKVLIFTKEKALGSSYYEHLCSYDPKVKVMLFLDFSKSLIELKKQDSILVLVDQKIQDSDFHNLLQKEILDQEKVLYISDDLLKNDKSDQALQFQKKLKASFKIEDKSKENDESFQDKIKAPDILAIGASTGGPAALLDLFSYLNPHFPFPIVIVNHIPAGDFAQSLADSLSYNSKIKVHLAKHGMVLNRGEAYLCPGGQHLIVKKVKGKMQYVASLTKETPTGACVPSIDMTFSSLAKLKFTHSAAIVLTGMGQDGSKGVIELSKEGACIYVQNPDHCLIPSMPRSAIKTGQVSKQLSLKELAYHINKRIFSFHKKSSFLRNLQTSSIDKAQLKEEAQTQINPPKNKTWHIKHEMQVLDQFTNLLKAETSNSGKKDSVVVLKRKLDFLANQFSVTNYEELYPTS